MLLRDMKQYVNYIIEICEAIWKLFSIRVFIYFLTFILFDLELGIVYFYE